ncbi:hypothetical protein G6F62_014831 [Rhizopus arrhizus]|nr:hypothetical protein G6F62_014831 [Rhizopus arrhizus]
MTAAPASACRKPSWASSRAGAAARACRSCLGRARDRPGRQGGGPGGGARHRRRAGPVRHHPPVQAARDGVGNHHLAGAHAAGARSGERRGGKACRARWSP